MNMLSSRFAWMALLGMAALWGCGDDSMPDPDAGDAATDTGNRGDAGDAGDAAPGPDAGDAGDAGPGPDAGPAPTAECDLPDLGATGSVVYLCDCRAGAASGCVAGDDANDGSTPSAPLQSIGAARQAFADMSPGDTVALCSGGSFSEGPDTNRWVNDRCQRDNPCYVRDYAAPWARGDEPLPQIVTEGNAFGLDDGGDANHEEGYVFANLSLFGAGTGVGVFVYNDIDDVTLCNLTIDNFAIGVQVAGSNPPEAGSDGLNARITLRSSRILNNEGQGWLGAGDGCSIEYSYFENNGFGRAVFNHNIYVSGSNGGTTDSMRVIGNELYRSAIVDGECQGVSLVVHGEHDGLLIEDNIVREDIGAAGGGCWGIAVDTGYSSREAFTNITIRGNTVINTGNVSIGVNACANCMIENNVIVHEQAFNGSAIAAPDRDGGAEDGAMTDVTVRNNSIYVTSGGRGIAMGTEGTGHSIIDNAIHYVGSGRFVCLSADLPAAAYTTIDYNVCFGAGEWQAGSGSLSEWQASSPFDANSRDVDPQFTSATGPAYDLRPATAASPLVDAGHPTLSATTDRTGAPREDGAPDIGAYEL